MSSLKELCSTYVRNNLCKMDRDSFIIPQELWDYVWCCKLCKAEILEFLPIFPHLQMCKECDAYINSISKFS